MVQTDSMAMIVEVERSLNRTLLPVFSASCRQCRAVLGRLQHATLF